MEPNQHSVARSIVRRALASARWNTCFGGLIPGFTAELFVGCVVLTAVSGGRIQRLQLVGGGDDRIPNFYEILCINS